MYLTYEEYTQMGGTLDETAFNDLEFEAEALVNWYTFNRLKKDTTIPVEVKRLIKYLITMSQENPLIVQNNGELGTGTGIISSQSNDGVSVSYNVLSAHDALEALKTTNEEQIKRFLQGVVNEAGQLLLYRGVYPNE